MKAIGKITLSVAAIAGAVWAGSIVSNTAEGANVSQPGTADDPVVTKSYVDQQIQKALGGGAVPTATAKPTASPTASPASSPAPSGNESVIVDVKPGQTLIASAGAEFIVRAGKAVVYSQDANGVADLTAGADIANGQPAPMNHLLSFPRDGRGIMVQDGQKMGLTVMVRGGYTLK